MTVNLTKKVRYASRERLDLVDKEAEDALLDATLAEYNKSYFGAGADGRLFFGWDSPTVTGPNTGLAIAANPGMGLDRSGNTLLREGTGVTTLPLTTNAINYVHLHYTEAQSDSSLRRFFIGGSEVSAATNTRYTRTSDFHITTTAYGGGAPVFTDFATTAVIGGSLRQLVPLYAVAVDAGNNITAIEDYRPLFAQDAPTMYTNAVPDFPFDFTVADAPTRGIGSVRDALVALADRIEQMKGHDWATDDFTLLQAGGIGVGGVAPTADRLRLGDVNFNIGLLPAGPTITFDSNDYIRFERATNLLTFTIGSASKLYLTSTSANISEALTLVKGGSATGPSGDGAGFTATGGTTNGKGLVGHGTGTGQGVYGDSANASGFGVEGVGTSGAGGLKGSSDSGYGATLLGNATRSAVHLGTQADPSTLAAGNLWVHSTSGLPSVRKTGSETARLVGRVHNIIASSSTLNATGYFSNGQYTIPAGVLRAGSTIRIRAGVRCNVAFSSGYFVALQLRSSAPGTWQLSRDGSFSNPPTQVGWVLGADITIRAVGSAVQHYSVWETSRYEYGVGPGYVDCGVQPSPSQDMAGAFTFGVYASITGSGTLGNLVLEHFSVDISD